MLEKDEIKKNISVSLKNLKKLNKQFYFDIDKDKYFLKNEDNIKIYESNILAKKIPQINIQQAGFAKYPDRMITNSIEKLDFKIDNSLYHPQTLRFEGYSQFPRPIIAPFSNISKIKLQKNLIKNLRKNENIFKTPKNKNTLNKKINTGLIFYSGTINNIVNTKNKNYVINKINEGLAFDEKKNIFSKKENIREKDKKILKKLKNAILTNSTNIVYGRKLKKPDEKFLSQFKINYNVYFKNPIKKIKLKNSENETEKKNYFEDLYITLNKKEVQHTLSLPNTKLFLNIDNNINSNDKKSRNANVTNNRNKTTIFSQQNNLLRLMKKNTGKDLNYEQKTETKANKERKSDTIKSYLDSLYSEKNNIFKKLEYQSKTQYKELLSEGDEQKQQENFFSNNKLQKPGDYNYLNIRTLSDLNSNCFKEKKLLTGFTKPKIKEINYRKTVPKYKSTFNIYQKEWEIHKLVNPLKYKLDEKKQSKELKFFKEKLEKGKDIINSLKSRNNKLFDTSNILYSQISKE